MRDGARTKSLSYEELRRFFDRSGTLLKMAHDFRTERLEKIKRGEVWSPMSEGPYCVLHWIPLSAMTGQHEIDIHDLMRSGNYNKFVLMKGSQSSRPNLDGFRLVEGSGIDSVSSGRMPGRPEVEQFERLFWNAQIFRSGALEMAFAVLFDSVEEENRKLIPQGWFVQELRKAMVGFKDGMLSLGISGPMVVGVSILFTQDFEFWARGIRSFVIPQSDRENLILPEEWVENLEAIENIDEIARPILDTLWQCFGLPRCEYYDEDGKWNPPQ